jgi:hypothetical protein
MMEQDVPTESLCCVWDNKLPFGIGPNNAFTERIRTIVLDSGSAKLGQWTAQRRNVADCWRLFGDESGGKLLEVIGMAVSADADNTHGHVLSCFGDVTLTPWRVQRLNLGLTER